MRATGIVRRMDDLGRIVIPKEIRRTLRIKEGAPLEIYTDNQKGIVLKKYSPISDLTDYSDEYAHALSESLECTIIVCDKDQVVSVSGGSSKSYLKKSIGKEINKCMENKESVIVTDSGNYQLFDEEESYQSFAIAPIISNEESIGAVIAMRNEKNKNKNSLDNVSLDTIVMAADFLGRIMGRSDIKI